MKNLFGIRPLYCERTLSVEESEASLLKSGLTQKRKTPLYSCDIQKELLIPCVAETVISALMTQNLVLNMI
jgi:hypothetical protein